MSKNIEVKHKALVPRLRFPEFRDDVTWKMSHLNHVLVKISNGLTLDQNNDSTGFMVTRIETISNNAIDTSKTGFVNTDQDISQYRLNIGDILFSNINSLSHIGKCVIVERDYRLYHGMNLLRLEVELSANNSKFIYYLLNSEPVRSSIKARANKAVNQASINQTELGRTSIIVPKRSEQQKIADCLSSLDTLIAAQADKIEALKTHKKGLMQQLFPREGETVPRLRFSEFLDAGEWEDKCLGQIGEIVTGKTPSTNDESLWNGSIQFVTPTDITEEKYQLNTRRSVVGSATGKLLPKYSTMFTCIASIGKIALSIKPCITNQQINSVIPKIGYENQFIYYSLLNIIPLIKATQANSTLPIINKTEFSKFTISVPIDFSEQQTIADCLSSLDALISAHTKKLNALKTHKKGLMQQLFPVLDEVQE
ncbi:MAG: restriction endonuclease subunit S [Magnetococcus sp. DMHC-6]